MGAPLDNIFDIRYIVTIYERKDDGKIKFKAMGSVYTEYCAVTSLKKAIDIESNKTRYYVELSFHFDQHTYDIEKVFITQVIDKKKTMVSAHYGLLRVSYKT